MLSRPGFRLGEAPFRPPRRRLACPSRGSVCESAWRGGEQRHTGRGPRGAGAVAGQSVHPPHLPHVAEHPVPVTPSQCAPGVCQVCARCVPGVPGVRQVCLGVRQMCARVVRCRAQRLLWDIWERPPLSRAGAPRSNGPPRADGPPLQLQTRDHPGTASSLSSLPHLHEAGARGGP